MSSILIVDDELTFRNLFGDCFARAGHAVAYAADGREALEQLARERPDLLVLDVMLPFKDGIEVLHEIRAQPGMEELPVILLSAMAADGPFYPFRWVEGPTYFACKPLSPPALVIFAECILRQEFDTPECRMAMMGCHGALPRGPEPLQ